MTADAGVHAVETSHKVYGKYSNFFFFSSASYIYSLDGTTTWNYQAFALSNFGGVALLGTIQVTQSTIVAVGKPVIAKIADVGSRGTAYALVLVFYVLGYIVVASAKNAATIIGGTVLYAVGYTGLQLLTQVIIAEITTLKWRGLVSGLMSAPNNATNVLQGVGWRWGYGMFAILVPVALAPLISTLLWGEYKITKLGLSRQRATRTVSIFPRTVQMASKLDLLDLILMGASIALILLPLTLTSGGVKGQIHSPSQIAMLIVGCVTFPLYILWDAKFAKYPVIPRRFLTNRTFLIAALVGALDFASLKVSFYISFTFLYSFVLVVKPWPLLHASYFASTQTIALSVFAILGGVICASGAGLMIHSRGANASDAEVVWSQILQGMDCGLASVSSQVSAQASVAHSDVAMITAVVLLITEIGGAIGGAIGMFLFSLAHYLPQLTDDRRNELFGSILAAAAKARGDPVREGVIMAYAEVMKIAATVVAVVPFVLSFWLPNWYLGDQQNAIDNVDLVREKVHEIRA
ncbi:major facilitator superfamily domain-containing protein [Crepidotus variabilis]|uniref:Major facilitator superfamily domain-containing protein n=1 Tax=Crepidotus variabilis TaxID=179855 RepID=A0A9P6JIN7_9AGAR|nr:major facilitator superfamily domain-containing protein [Crepidotus variabilis]